jgi:hypothetical protein
MAGRPRNEATVFNEERMSVEAAIGNSTWQREVNDPHGSARVLYHPCTVDFAYLPRYL